MSRTIVCIALGALFLWAAVSLFAGDPGKEQKVTIDNFRFAPQVLTVKAGTNVTWTNRDDVPHAVVSTSKKFASRVLDTDERFSVTFRESGTYEYYCSVHPHMTGKIIVQ
jgi:amicyanin